MSGLEKINGDLDLMGLSMNTLTHNLCCSSPLTFLIFVVGNHQQFDL